LLDLALDRALLRQEQVLRELLRDGRPALTQAPVQDVGDESADDTERVDAVMFIEAAVFDGDEGLRHIWRHVLQRERLTGEIAAPRERSALVIDNVDRGRPL